MEAAMYIAIICAAQIVVSLILLRVGWTSGYRARRDAEERERNAPTLEQIRAGVEASARLGY